MGKIIRFYDVVVGDLVVAERMTIEIATILAEALDEHYKREKSISIVFSQREEDDTNGI